MQGPMDDGICSTGIWKDIIGSFSKYYFEMLQNLNHKSKVEAQGVNHKRQELFKVA